MRLYDRLRSDGYYTTQLHFGTPPQQFALIVDTGSIMTYVPCSNCQKCGKHQDPRFQAKMSSSYQKLKCNPSCNCDKDRKQCTYEREYAEMSSSIGFLGEDVMSFGEESELALDRVILGCENVETGDIYTQHADGIMGLGHNQLSIVDQLVEKGVISNSFSLCYGGMDVGGGAMVLGGITPPPDMFLGGNRPYYNIELQEINVAGKPLMLGPRIFDGKYRTILDSGTTYAYLPHQAFLAFKDAIMKEVRFLKQICGPDPNYNDICFLGAGRDVSQLSIIFPEVDMVFNNRQKLSLSPENYLFQYPKVSGAYCLGIFPTEDTTTLLGRIIFRNTLVTYNREDHKIGFWRTNCTELWRRLRFPSASTPPLEFHLTNTITGMAPNPGGSHWDVLQGAFPVRFITFEMSISMNNSNVRSNFIELSDFIAHELQLGDSQIRLLNCFPKGSNYLVKWGVFPAESVNYISSATALSMIQSLRHMHFPEKFGSYEVVNLNIESQTNPKWWRHQVMAMALGILVTLLLCSAIISLLSIWRPGNDAQRKYRWIDAVVPEQELQPFKY